jgi:hypothetical protein
MTERFEQTRRHQWRDVMRGDAQHLGIFSLVMQTGNLYNVCNFNDNSGFIFSPW